MTAKELLDTAVPYHSCDACNSRGWLLVQDNGYTGIERCDTCILLDDDDQAVEYVAALAVLAPLPSDLTPSPSAQLRS